MPKKHIFNPLFEDFSVTYDVHGNSQPETFVIRSQEMAEFDDYLADHIAKHLADKMLHKRGIRTNHEDDYKEILQEIYV